LNKNIDLKPVNLEATSKGMKPQATQVAGVCIALVLAVLAVFGQTAGFGFVNYDDGKYVYDNPVVAKGLTLQGALWALTFGEIGHWHPLTWLTHMADCQVYGLWAGGHHLTNVALHALAAVLLFLALREMTGNLWRGAFVAGVFAIHPLRAESVAWISERKDVLSGVFFMLTLWAYARYARQPSRRRYAVVVLSYGLGLLSKNMLMTLPFVLLLLDWWPLQRKAPGGAGDGRVKAPFWGLVREKIPLFLLMVGSCVATVLVPEKVTDFDRLPFLERIGNALVSYCVYLRQMVFPAGMAILYPNPPNGQPFWKAGLAVALLAVLSIIVVACRNKRPYLLVGWLWYLGMLIPVIGIIQISSSAAHADRYTYLSEIGLVLAGTWAVGDWSLGWKHRQAVLGVLAAVVTGALMVCAWKQTAHWKGSETLWTHALACTTGNYVAHNNLGDALLQKGQPDEAMPHFHKALEIKLDNGEAHFNLGNVLRLKGRTDEAITQYQEAVRFNPSIGQAHNNLGTALRQKGKLDEAIAQFQWALQILPDNESIHFNLAKALFQKGRLGEAITQFKLALQLEPADMEALNNLAWCLATCPQASLRNGATAVQLARQANELAGGKNPVILATLAAAFAETGRFGDAVRTAQKAIDLARTAGRRDLAAKLDGELQRYQAGLPLRQ
jgi:Flp pilus assembly protein TadD